MSFTLTEELQRLGVEKSLGAELERQINTGDTSVLRLQHAGMPTLQAELITKGIAASTINRNKLVGAGMPTQVAALLAENIAKPPVNTAAPVLSGTPTVGQVLTVTNGTWTSPTGVPTFTRKWFRGTTQLSATGTTYTLVAADVGAMISCQVTATNVNGSAVATSNQLGPVVAA